MTDTTKRKKALYGILAAIGVTAGAAGIAAAATSQSSPTTTTANAEHENDGNDHGDKIEYTSSVIDQASANEAEGTEEDDAAEAARLEKLATVTLDEAKAAALAEQPGKVTQATLESEDGNVVYDVEVTTSSGTVDLTIDAGNAKVLEKDTEGREQDDDKGAAHENESGTESGDANGGD